MFRWLTPVAPTSTGAASRTYVATGLIVLVATGLSFLLSELPLANLALVFLMAVIVVAALFGAAAAVFAGVLSVVSFNFFFTAPHFTLRVTSQEDVATLLLFVLIAVIAGNLAARMRRAINRTKDALNRMSTLYQFSRSMITSSNGDDILRALTTQLATLADAPVATYLLDVDGAPTLAVWERKAPGGEVMEAVKRAAAVDQSRRENGGAALVLSFATPRQQFGLLAFEGARVSADRLEMIRTLVEQAALAYERTRLAGDLEQARVATETERLRSALLSSVSHDLRTPLASIIGGASSLLELEGSLDAAARNDLQLGILNEAEKLNRYIQNLLDMTRFGRGEILLKRDWVDLFDVVSGAMGRMQRELAPYQVGVHIDRDASILYGNAPFLEQMLVNLLDNAARFSAPGGAIRVAARREDQSTIIDVVDEGEGVPEAERERIFDMFYTADKGDRRTTGIGLGLTICRAIAVAHNGAIAALAGPSGRGTCMRITLPSGDAPPGDASDD